MIYVVARIEANTIEEDLDSSTRKRFLRSITAVETFILILNEI
jgi:hypothetical protein